MSTQPDCVQADQNNENMKDIANKINIARNTVIACFKAQNTLQMRTVEFFTGVSAFGKNTERMSFKKFKQPFRMCRKRRVALRNAIVHFYIKGKPLIGNSIMSYMYSYYEQNLIVIKFVPESDRFMFFENPEYVSKRMKYLTKIIKIRSQQRHIVYIRQMYYKPGCAKFSLIAISSKDGVINITHYQKFQPEFLEYWLKEMVLPQLTNKKTVFVMDENHAGEHVRQEIEMSSSKAEMIRVLEENDIPHDPTRHRADLYALIKKYKINSYHKSKAQQLIESEDHETLLVPNSLTILDYYDELKSFCLNNTEQLDKNLIAMHHYSYLLQKQERKIYNEDKKIEQSIDNMILELETRSSRYGQLLEKLPMQEQLIRNKKKKFKREDIFVDKISPSL